MSPERVRCSLFRTFSSARAMAGGSEIVKVDVERIERGIEKKTLERRLVLRSHTSYSAHVICQGRSLPTPSQSANDWPVPLIGTRGANPQAALAMSVAYRRIARPVRR